MKSLHTSLALPRKRKAEFIEPMECALVPAFDGEVLPVKWAMA